MHIELDPISNPSQIVVDMHLFDSLLQRNSVLAEVSFGQGWRVCQRGLANDPATSGNRWVLAAGPGRATLLHYHRSHDVLLPTQHLQERARVVMNDAKQKPGGELLLCGARDVSIIFRKGETQLKFYLISDARTKAGRRTLSLPCLSRRVAKCEAEKIKGDGCASACFRGAFKVETLATRK